MRKIAVFRYTALLFPFFLIVSPASAATLSQTEVPDAWVTQTRTENQNGTARGKLRFRERLALQLLKKKGCKTMEAGSQNATDEPQKGERMNASSLVLGLGGVILVSLGLAAGSPIVVILGFGAAVVGLPLGIRGLVKKYPRWWMGLVGLILSGAAIIAVLAVVWDFLMRYE